MMYNLPLMTHIYIMWAKLTFFKVVLFQLSLMEQLFLKKSFSRTCKLRGKNDVQLTCYDQYISYVSKIDGFQSSFVLLSTNGTAFTLEIFLCDLYIKRKKMMYNLPLMTHIYIMWAKLTFFKVVLFQLSLMEQLFLKKSFSRTCKLRGKNDVKLTCYDQYISYVSKIDGFQSSFVLIFTNGTAFT